MRILITGGSGLLALNWALKCRENHDVHVTLHKRDSALKGTTSHRVALDNQVELNRVLSEVRPELVIHTAGLTDVDKCEEFPEISEKANLIIAGEVAIACTRHDIPLIHISTDHLFDGKNSLKNEEVLPNPLNEYAKHKAAAESLVLANKPDALIIRTSFFGWGPSYRKSLSDQILESLEKGDVIYMFDDVIFNALSTRQVIELSMKAVSKKITGVINICSSEPISKYEFSVKLAQAFNFDSDLIQPVQASRIRGNVFRPLDLSLSNKRMLSSLGVDDITASDTIACLKLDQSCRAEIQRVGKIIPYGKHFIDEADITSVCGTLRGGNLTQGPKIPEFEERIAAYVGAKYAVAVSSATAGLHLSYKALGLGPGKSLLTSPITFVSTANAALFCGGNVKFADINRSSVNLDFAEVAKVLASDQRISIVAPVVFAGSTDGIPDVSMLAKSTGRKVVEDAAHGLGAQYGCGALVGSCKYSDCTVFSLHPVKSIAAGEGGVVTTNNPEIYRKLLRLRSHGINKKDDLFQDPENAFTEGQINPWYYEMTDLGFHYRLTDIQASLAISQLEKIDVFIERRRNLADRYTQRLRQLKWIAPAQDVNVSESSNHLFPVKIDFERLGLSRRKLMKNLASRNIITQVHYIPVPMHPFYRKLGFDSKEYVNSAAYYRSALSIPLFYGLTDDDFDHVCNALQGVFGC